MKKIFLFTVFFLLQNSLHAFVKINNDHLHSIYGKDDRKFVNQCSDKKIKEISKSIALIMPSRYIEKNKNDTKLKANPLFNIPFSYDTDPEINICKNQKFVEHLAAGLCTGFLVTKNLLVTARHCFKEEFICGERAIIFNVQSSLENKNSILVNNDNVYACKKIYNLIEDEKFSKTSELDFVIIELDRDVLDATPLKMRSKNNITEKSKVFMIGHPLGLPLIKTSDAKVKLIDSVFTFEASLDSFEGNSGSPIFNAKNFEVEGILYSGKEDFTKDVANQCLKYKKYKETSKNSESILSVLPIQNALDVILDLKNQDAWAFQLHP